MFLIYPDIFLPVPICAHLTGATRFSCKSSMFRDCIVLCDVASCTAASCRLVAMLCGWRHAHVVPALTWGERWWCRALTSDPAFSGVLIAVDTFYAEVAAAAVSVGAHVVNDVSGGTLDRDMHDTVPRLPCDSVPLWCLPSAAG